MGNTRCEKIKKILSGSAGTIASGIVLFACAVAFVPSAGIFRTIPFFVAGGAVSQLLGMSASTSVLMSAAMTLCTYLVSGRSVSSALFFAVAACLFALTGVYAAKLFAIVKNTENKAVKKRGAAYISVSFLIALFLSFVLCGNAVSYVLNNNANTAYLKGKYGSEVQKRYTCYEALRGCYCTYVSLADGKEVYGNDDSLYISTKNNKFNDDVRDYYEEKMLNSANLALSEIIAGATFGFNVVSSDIPFEEGEVLNGDSSVSDYLGRINYVVSFDSLVSENEKDKFSAICAETVLEISRRGFEFGNIVFCAGDAKSILFCAEVTPETSAAEVYSLVLEFDEESVLKYGVDENDVLAYWDNK